MGSPGRKKYECSECTLSVFDGSPGRHQCLAGDLTAENALVFLVELGAPEDIDLNGLEVEQIDQEVEGRAHWPMFAGRRRGRHRAHGGRPPLPCGGVTAANPDDERDSCFPRGSPGRGDGGPSDRGRQRQQRLVGLEHNPVFGCVEPSGDACDSFHRWREDIALVAGMGLGAYRFSLEWSRIEPAEGEFWSAALEHYRRMCAAVPRCGGIAPVVTFHHFTAPLARAARRWSRRRPERFALRDPGHRVPGRSVGWACTINEPNVVGVMGYFQGDSTHRG